MALGTILVALLIGFIASIAGGVMGGVLVGGKHLGLELAALMGGFYGPLAGVPGTILGVAIMLIGMFELLSGLA